MITPSRNRSSGIVKIGTKAIRMGFAEAEEGTLKTAKTIMASKEGALFLRELAAILKPPIDSGISGFPYFLATKL